MEERTVHVDPAGMHLASLSPSRERIAVAHSGRPDVLALRSLGGREVARVEVPSLLDVAWCGEDRLSLLVREEEGLALRSWHPATGELRLEETPGVTPGGGLACSPDGQALLFHGRSDGLPGLYLLTPGRGLAQLDLPGWIPERGGQAPQVLGWLPPYPPEVPEELRIVGPRARAIPWGEPQRLEALLVRSRGGDVRTEPSWRAREGAQLRIHPNGHLVGLSGGTAWVIAEWEGWLRDSVRVEVQGSGHPNLRFRDPFLDVALPGWLRGEAREENGADLGGWRAAEGVLQLQGDGAAVLVSRDGTPLPTGGTLELEFRLPLDRMEGQELRVCLEAADGASPGLENVLQRDPSLPSPRGLGACLTYPAATLGRWDPREVELRGSGAFPGSVLSLPEVLPTDAWVPLALRISLDGRVGARVGWEEVEMDVPVHLPPPGERAWRVRIEGRAEGTELELRNLLLWEGKGTHP